MNVESLTQDAQQWEILLRSITTHSVDFLQSLPERPTSVASSVAKESSPLLPERGLGATNALAEFEERLAQKIVASSGPRYWGFVTGGATPAAIMGDWLASVFDQNTQATVGQGDVSAGIELETIQLMRSLLGLPDYFFGGFVTGATMSNFTCLAVARQWYGKTQQFDAAKEGIKTPIPIFSATPHSSSIKSLAMLGIGSQQFSVVEVLEGNREAMNVADLEEKIQALNGQPFILISSAGTVNTVDYDDFQAIAALRDKYQFWWHIDAAFGGFAACSPQYKYLLSGWEQADSITIDNHKWMNVPYDSAVFLVQEKHRVLQTETFQNSNAPYLGNPFENFSYLNFLPENSRRLRALPVWFTLKAYGKEGYQAIVENAIAMAQAFSQRIEQHEAFVLLAPTRLNNVCFTLGNTTADVPAFLHRVNATGKVFMTPTVYGGQKGIRAAFVNWRTSLEDVEKAFTIMEECL